MSVPAGIPNEKLATIRAGDGAYATLEARKSGDALVFSRPGKAFANHPLQIRFDFMAREDHPSGDPSVPDGFSASAGSIICNVVLSTATANKIVKKATIEAVRNNDEQTFSPLCEKFLGSYALQLR